MMNKLSIVTTLYRSAPYIQEFYERIIPEIKKITTDYEIIFVDDGSPDDARDVAKGLIAKDANVKVAELSKNFGHHKAIMTGLSLATGDHIFLIDVDLEEPPELLSDFWKELNDTHDTDVVYGVQETRKGKIFERVSGNLFFNFFNAFSDTKITRNLSLVRLMTKRYNENLIKHTERELIFSGLCALTGYNQREVFFKKTSKGSTTYHFSKKLDLAINHVVSFSSKPLVYIFYLGMILTLLSVIAIFYLFIRKLFFNVFEGWTSIVTSILFVGGVTIFSIGIVGIYLSKIFIEVKNRPYTIIKKIHEG